MSFLPGLEPDEARRSGDDEWYTPPEVLRAVRAALGGDIDTDPCAAPGSLTSPSSLAHRDNGLERAWYGRVFCNPPYSDVAPWAERCADHHDQTGAPVVMLLPARVEVDYWFRFIWPTAASVFFPAGRIRFVSPDGATLSSGKFTSVLPCWGVGVGERLRDAWPGGGALVR